MRMLGVLLTLALLGTVQVAWAKEKAKAPQKVAPHERDSAIQRGMRYLDKTVFRLPEAQGTPRKPFTVGVHGLVHALADGTGRRSDGGAGQLKQARAYLARYIEQVHTRTTDPEQLPRHAGHFDSNHVIQYTWPVAMAGLFFGELHARGRHKGEAQKVLGRLRPILRATQRASGGWGHHQTQGAAVRGAGLGGGYPDTLLSSSFVVAATVGLVDSTPAKGAKRAAAPEHTRKAVDYFRTAQLSNGNFPYDPSQRSAHRSLSGVSRTAGSCFAMWALGVPWKDEAMQRSLGFVDGNFDYLNEGHGSSTLNLLYGALLQRVRGARAWNRFKARYFRPILDLQDEDGAFGCICENKAFGATNDTDPFSGKGPGSGARVVKRAGNMDLLRGPFANGTKAYVTAIHTLILLLDRTTPRLLEGKRPPPSGSPGGAVTPR